MARFGSDNISPGYIELVATSKRKTKEDLRIKELIPQEILEYSEGLQAILAAYYEFMNMEEFIYLENQEFTSVVLDNRVEFRIPDPENKNTRFFTDESGVESALQIELSDGSFEIIPLTSINVSITNGNELPGSLAKSTSEIGKTFTVRGLDNYNNSTARLTTQVVNWVSPGPSYAINTLEESLDIDTTLDQYLELIQKEIAPFIPRNITVDKRTLYKNIIEFYRLRGSSDSIEVFFRLLFNDSVEITQPYDQTLIPSSGAWDINPSLPRGGQYLNNKGFLSDNIKIHDSFRYQKFSYLIKTGRGLVDWEALYNRLVHPAGFIFFGEILILIELTRRVLGDTDKNIRINRKTLSSMPGRQPGVIGDEDFPVLIKAFASVFAPVLYPRIHKSGQLSLNLVGGALNSISIANSGWGYETTPNVTFSGNAIEGQTTVEPTIQLVMGQFGEIDEVIIIDGGSGWQSLFINVEGNPNSTQIADLFILGANNKSYKTAPTIIFSEPTAKDAFGDPLPTNETASAVFVLDSNGRIVDIDFISRGSGYIFEPDVHVNSGASNEFRAKNIERKLIIYSNHPDVFSPIFDSNNYFSDKTKAESQLLQLNYNVQQLGDVKIEDVSANINRNNVNSFIQIN
jgi:hypothetical protein